MSVVLGLDIGNENCVIAFAKLRGIDVLLNDESKRETPAVVSFADKQRLIGSAGAASALMNPRSTISQLKRLVGRRFDEPGIRDELRRLPYEVSEGKDGEILIHARYTGKDYSFTPVQVLGMLLAHLRQMAERVLETQVSECVIGVPAYFTDLQRRAYLNAAAIAGLKPLRLLQDGAATALGYGIYKTDPLEAAINVVFVDIGHCDTQVTVARFMVGQMKVLAHAFDRDLGGRDFDEVLFQYFAGQFKEQYKIDVLSNVRASIRLRVACEKLKKILSANAEAPINIECLMDEIDVKGFIKREEFERLSLGLLDRILVPCSKALADAGLTVKDIHSVELVGSGSRIPAISRNLTEFFRRELSRTLNASECIARGCALQCAMLSPIFRVKEYEVQDAFPFSIGLLSEEGSISVLFKKGQLIPSTKFLTLHRSEAFHVEAIYADHCELPPGVSQKISNFMVGPFQVSPCENFKVKIKIQLNLHGIISVESASLIEDDRRNQVSRGIPNLDNTKSGSCPAACNGDVNATESSAPSGSGNPIKAGPGEEQPIGANVIQRVPRRLDVVVKGRVFDGMTEDDLFEAQELEQQLAQQDKIIERTKDRKNALEAYVYEIRNKLFEKYRSFANESEKDGISRTLQQTEEWLYDDGDDETENVYSAKMEELKKLVDPIENRYKEEEARAQATRELLNNIVEYRMGANSLASPEKDAVFNECIKAEQWLRDKMQLQDSLPKNADPLVWSKEINKITEELNRSCLNIMGSKSSSRPEDFMEGKTKLSDNMETD